MATDAFNNLSSASASAGAPAYLNTAAENGQSFVSLSTPQYLSSLTVSLERTGAATGTLTAYLYSDVSNAPGSLIATIGSLQNIQISNTAYTNYTFTPTLTPATLLAANTNYYIVLVDSTANTIAWDYAGDTSGTRVAGTYYTASGNSAPQSSNTAGYPWRMEVAEAPCFVTGTLIRTVRGDVAVEDLVVGDRAVIASGEDRTITWIGHRDLDGRGRALPHDQAPIRVRQGAFGHDADGRPVPARDLRLSPGHPVLVGADADGAGGHLVPIMCLINGTTIARDTAATAVTYWHVELDSHDILLAEGLPAESYYDMGSRAWFAGEDGALNDPEFVPADEHGRCRPVAIDGPVVEAERLRIDGVFAAELASHGAWNDADVWLAA